MTIDAAAQATQDQVADDLRRELQRRLALTSHKVVGFSGCLFVSMRRLGKLRPEDLTEAQRERLETVARVNLIDARVSTGFIGHSYFYRHPAVSADLILLLRDNLDPGSPGRPLA